MALLFENAVAARKIFERLRSRFGDADDNEEITISIVRQLPGSDPHHYCVQIASKAEAASSPVIISTRSMTMTPSNGAHLEMFLAEHKRHGAFQLLPAVLPSAGSTQPKFFFDLRIRKKLLTAKTAAEVTEHDIESLALRHRGLKFAS